MPVQQSVYPAPAQPVYPAQQPVYPTYAPVQEAQVIEKKEKTKKVAKKRSEMSVGEQLLDSLTKSATTSAGREIGRSLTRSLLGILGLKK